MTACKYCPVFTAEDGGDVCEVCAELQAAYLHPTQKTDEKKDVDQ